MIIGSIYRCTGGNYLQLGLPLIGLENTISDCTYSAEQICKITPEYPLECMRLIDDYQRQPRNKFGVVRIRYLLHQPSMTNVWSHQYYSGITKFLGPLMARY